MPKNTDKPTISLVMPVHNAAPYLSVALESILAQTFTDWELLLVDDASTDDSLKIALQFAKQDSRFKVFKNTRKLGVAATANKAIAKASGQFIARMDADDISVPERLVKQLKFLQRNLHIVAVGGQCTVIDPSSHQIGTKTFPTDPNQVASMLFRFASIQQPAMMVNTALLPADFEWYNTQDAAGEEHQLLFRLLHHGQLANLPDIILEYRMHGANISLQGPKRDFETIAQARLEAVKEGYRPSLLSWLVFLAQLVVVKILPSKLLYTIFAKLRGLNNAEYFQAKKSAAAPDKLSSLSLFYPMHNEEENVQPAVEQALAVLPQIAKKFGIIIVDDGSTDSTAKIADQLAAKYQPVKVIHQPNIGYGGALQTGFATAKYDWIFFTDGDLQFDLHDLHHLLPAATENRVVLGYRIKRADSFKRILLAKLLKIWNYFFFQFPAGIKDIDCAFKLFHRSALTDLFPLTSQGAMISTELLLKIVDREVPFAQVGVRHLPRQHGQQTGAKLNVIRGAIIETWRLWQARQAGAWKISRRVPALTAFLTWPIVAGVVILSLWQN